MKNRFKDHCDNSCGCTSHEKSMTDKQLKVFFCPKCKSTNVKFYFELSNLYGMFPMQRCNTCKLEGKFPQLVTTKKALEDTVSEKKSKQKKKIIPKKKKVGKRR